MWMLRAGRGGVHTPIDILTQLTEQSRKSTCVKTKVQSQSQEYIDETALSHSFCMFHMASQGEHKKYKYV